MADTLDLSTDDGHLIVLAPHGVTVELDLYDINDQVYRHFTKNKGRPDSELWPGLVEILTAAGLPKCSYRWADQFVRGITDLVAAKKKEDAERAVSLASMASIPGGPDL